MRLLSHNRWPATPEYLYESMDFVISYARALGFGEDRIGEIALAVEEILVNIVKYAYQGGSVGDMAISCSDDEEKLIIEISDSGVPFNMLDVADPVISGDIDERVVGGLGIFFVKQLMDEVTYRREHDQNRLTLAVFKKRTF